MKVLVLMSTYNGEKFLRAQLDSLCAQTQPVDILVRDDGSSDSTREILEEYKAQGKLDWYGGENLNSSRSFWNLVRNAPKADYYAFCDQDDVWLEDKVEVAVRALREAEDLSLPLLYCGTVSPVTVDLEPIAYKTLSSVGKTDFAHALLFSLSAGCTFVYNAAARERMEQYDMEKQCVTYHDWLTHKIVAMTGEIIYDRDPHILYRQHGNNVVGAGRKSIGGFFRRLKNLFFTSASVRSDVAKSLYEVYGDGLDEKNKEILRTVAFYKEDKKLKKRFLHSEDFRVDGKSDFALRTLIRFNKI